MMLLLLAIVDLGSITVQAQRPEISRLTALGDFAWVHDDSVLFVQEHLSFSLSRLSSSSHHQSEREGSVHPRTLVGPVPAFVPAAARFEAICTKSASCSHHCRACYLEMGSCSLKKEQRRCKREVELDMCPWNGLDVGATGRETSLSRG